MPAAAIATIVISLILLGAVAVYLVRVVLLLRGVTDTLGKILFGVRAIAHRLEPVNPVLEQAAVDLDAVAGALEGIVAKVTSAQPEDLEPRDSDKGWAVDRAT